MTGQDSVSELRARIDELEAKIEHLERENEHGIETMWRKLLPDDVRGHLRSARKEQLLALRSMLDHWIEHSEHADSEPPRRRESITVE